MNEASYCSEQAPSVEEVYNILKSYSGPVMDLDFQKYLEKQLEPHFKNVGASAWELKRECFAHGATPQDPIDITYGLYAYNAIHNFSPEQGRLITRSEGAYYDRVYEFYKSTRKSDPKYGRFLSIRGNFNK